MARTMPETGQPTRPRQGGLAGARAVVDQVFMWGALLFLAAGVVQVFLAGLGVFGLGGRDLDESTSLDPHRTLGFSLGGLAAVLLALALIARANARTVVIALALALLANLAQSLLASAGESTAWVGGLHALDGLLMLGLAGYLYADARRRDVVRRRRPAG